MLQVALLAWSAYRHSPTIDEVRWLPAGLYHWQTGRFDRGIANPPLPRVVAAVPVLAGYQQDLREKASAGRDLVSGLGVRSFWMFTLGRWALIPISLVGGYVCFRWSQELYGTSAGLMALTLWCFCPNLLGHFPIVANDAPAAAAAVLAGYLFWRWLKSPTWEWAVAAGFGLGVAALCKMTLLVFFGLWPALWIAWVCMQRRSSPARISTNRSFQMAAILLLGIYVINLGYLFDGSFRQLRSFHFVSKTLSGVEGVGDNRFVDSWVGLLPIPLPADFVRGLDQVKGDFEGRIIYAETYLRGSWREQGVWYYYFYALAIKVPLGTWVLIVLSLHVRLASRDQFRTAADELVLLTPVFSLLLIASTQREFTDHLRYIFPIFPFVFVWTSRVAESFSWRWRPMSVAIATALMWSVGSSLWVYPHSLSYFNELVGGPKNGHHHLLSSNIDYGQDLIYLKEWYNDHPEARPFHLAYWNLRTVDPAILGIEFSVPPSSPPPDLRPPDADLAKLGPQPGWHAVNVNLLHGDHWPGRSHYPEFGYYEYLLNFEPVARVGYSINIYQITVKEANRVRKQMRLPELADPESM